MDSENDLQQYVKRILADNPYKLVLSGTDGMRETLRRLANGYQAERIVNRQAFQSNLTSEETYPYVLSRFEEGYRQLNAWSESYEYNLRVAKRGRALFSRKANKKCHRSVRTAQPCEELHPAGGGSRAAAGRYGNLHAGREGHSVSI